MGFYETGASFIESKMIDTCSIYRDAPGVGDDTLNVATGELEAPDGDRDTVYTGICLLKAISTRDMYFDEAGTQVFRKIYDLLIPWDEEEVKLGDIVVITASTYDDTVENKELRVVEYRHATHKVYRRIRVEDLQQDYSGTNPTS